MVDDWLTVPAMVNVLRDIVTGSIPGRWGR